MRIGNFRTRYLSLCCADLSKLIPALETRDKLVSPKYCRSANPPDRDWAAIEQLVRTTDLTFYEVSKRTGVPLSTIRHRAAKGQWRPRLKPPPPRSTAPIERAPRTPADARRALIQRFYKAIDTKLKQMEQRMKKEMQNDEGTQSAADHERDTRAIGGLINQLAKISEYEADLDRPTGQGDDFAIVAAEAERYRRELAERLARLIPPVE